MVPRLLQRVLMYNPLSCYRVYKGYPFQGPVLRDHVATHSEKVRTSSSWPDGAAWGFAKVGFCCFILQGLGCRA